MFKNKKEKQEIIHAMEESKAIVNSMSMEKRLYAAGVLVESSKKIMRVNKYSSFCSIGGEVKHFANFLNVLSKKGFNPVTVLPTVTNAINRKNNVPIIAYNFPDFKSLIQDGRSVIDVVTLVEVPFNLLIGSSIAWMNNIDDEMAHFVHLIMIEQCDFDLANMGVHIARIYAFGL